MRDTDGPIEWRSASAILATLFLNFAFWHLPGGNLAMIVPIGLFVIALAVTASLVTGLFFLGPALAGHRAQQSLMDLVESSVGRIPAVGVRLCCVLFLLLWIAKMVSLPVLWLTYFIPRHPLPPVESGLVAGGVLVFLFLTASTKLAWFTIRLAIALLIAASLRVHDGWPAMLKGFDPQAGRSLMGDLARGASGLGFYLAPLLFVGAGMGYRLHGRRGVAMTGLMGIAVPLFGTLLAVGLIGVATWASPHYVPSLQPNMGMALWWDVPRRNMAVGMMIASITMFGALRFGVRALSEFAWLGVLGKRFGVVPLACLVSAMAWCSVHVDRFERAYEVSAVALAVAGAVVSADFLAGRVGALRWVDWIGSGTLLLGIGVPFFAAFWLADFGPEDWWHPWLVPSCGIAFLGCLFGRWVERR